MGKPARNTNGEFCPAAIDEHGKWIPGFVCPRPHSPQNRFCCGPAGHQYCCGIPGDATYTQGHGYSEIPLIIGVVVAGIVVAGLVTMAFCYFCHGCTVYKRRKRSQSAIMETHNNALVTEHSSCQSQTCNGEELQPNTCYYPTENPPPYANDYCISHDEKQPLNPVDLCTSVDNDDNSGKYAPLDPDGWDSEQFQPSGVPVLTFTCEDIDYSEVDEMSIPLKVAEELPSNSEPDT